MLCSCAVLFLGNISPSFGADALVRQDASASLPEPVELVQGALPDPGPRYERLPERPSWSRFEEGVALYGQARYVEAQLHFTAMLKDQPETTFGESILSFLADSALKGGSPDARPIELIEGFHAVIREYPKSTNAKRAAWRIGDVYRGEGWYQEAQFAYQHAMTLSEPDAYDANRAMLGLGYTLRGLAKWKDSVQAFEQVIKRTTAPELAASAVMGQAHSLYRAGRIKEADALYESYAARRPAAFRKDPYALLRYADTAESSHRPAVMREQLLQFANLYPEKPEAPSALAHIADSYRAAERWVEAGLFYAAVLRRYPDAAVAPAAQLRYADVSAHRGPEEEPNSLQRVVAVELGDVPLPAAEIADPRRLFEAVAKTHEDSAVGSEALLYLGESLERADKRAEALAVYERLVARTGKIDRDPWPEKGGLKLVQALRARLEAAVAQQDDFELVSLFHRHGPLAARLYAGTELLLTVADAHQRLDFPVEAVRLYQSIVRDAKADSLHERALMGLGRSYLAQGDSRAAQSIFERYRLQFPVGRFGPEAVQGILTSSAQAGKDAEVIRLGRQWLKHHPRDAQRTPIQLAVADALGRTEQFAEAAAIYADITQRGTALTATDSMRYAEALRRLKRPGPALTSYRQALAAGLSDAQDTWAKVQVVRLANDLKQQALAEHGVRALSESDDALIRRVAGVLQSDVAASSASSPAAPKPKPGKR